MQNASVNYVQASTGAGGVWADPKLMVDWMEDGYDVTPNLMDGYNRNVSSGWGGTDTGQTWINTGGVPGDYSVVYDGGNGLSSGYGTHIVNVVTGTYQTRSSVLDGPLVFVTRQIAKLTMPVPSGDNIESLSYYRFIDVNNHYRAGVVILPGGAVTIAIVRNVGGVETALANNIPIGLTYTGDPSVLVSEDRMLADGTLQARAYIEGTTPPDWQVTVRDTDQILTSGVPGLRTTVYPGNVNTRPITVKYVSYQVINGLPDDISGQAGGWSVVHHLDDGYPDAVTFISGVGTPTLGVELGAPPAYLTDDDPQTTAEYYSPYNTTSAIYGRDRDVPPVRLDAGVVGVAGPERITVFTGQMADIPVKRGRAELQAVSATRLKLAKLVQPPAVNGAYQGANATWPISYALAACGVYASPPPQAGCRWWAPMHGSIRAFIPSANFERTDSSVSVNNVNGPTRRDAIRYTDDGPFVTGLEFGCNSGFVQRGTILATSTDGLHLEDGPDMISSTGMGKFEAWIRGDDVNLNFAPGGSGTITTLHRMIIKNTNGSGVDCFIRTDNRKLQITITDGTNSALLNSTNGLPTDGAWHFVGYAWDIATKTVWVNLDGTVNSGVGVSVVAASFPATDTYGTLMPEPFFTLPVAEAQMTGGANPNTGPWLRDIPFTAQALVNLSAMDLVNVAEPAPREAWEYISGYAQAELAAMRTDELDVFNYLTFGWWVKDAQQTVTDIYSTEFNSSTVDINIDPTKIRNEIIVSFDEVISPNGYGIVFTTNEAFSIPPGISQLILPLSRASYELRGFTFTNILAADTVQPMNVNSVSFNGAPDGTGFYYSSAYVTLTVIEWNPGSVTIEFDNDSGLTLYTANDKNWPSLTIAAKSQDSGQATATDVNVASVLRRGERSLPVTAQALQTRVNARRLARRLKMALRDPQPAAEELTLFGEARRQPGDLVTFADPTMTRVSGNWRVQSVGHDYAVSGDSVDYTNAVIVRPTRDICIVGTGIIGQTLVGPKE